MPTSRGRVGSAPWRCRRCAGWRCWRRSPRRAGAPLDVGEQARLASRFSKIASMITSAWATPSPAGSGIRRSGEAHLRRIRATCARSAWRPGRWPGDAFDALVLQRHDHAAQGLTRRRCRRPSPRRPPRGRRRAKVGVLLAEGLQALLQVEHAHQVLGGGRAEDRLQRTTGDRPRQRVAAVAAQMSMIAKGAG